MEHTRHIQGETSKTERKIGDKIREEAGLWSLELFRLWLGLWIDSEYDKKSLESFEQDSGIIWSDLKESSWILCEEKIVGWVE